MTDDMPENEGNDALFEKLKGWYRVDLPHTMKWRKEAKEDFLMYSNDQWSEEDKKALIAKSRPPIVFNNIAPLVNAVVGSEINNRREVQYIPRQVGAALANEMLTAAAEWFRDQTGAEDEESDMFQDAVISGMGWTDTRLDFEEDQNGAPIIERLDGMEMVWDRNAVKPNLSDAQRLFRVKEMPLEVAQEMFPGVDSALLHASWAKSFGENPEQPIDADHARRYDDTHDEVRSDQQLVTIVEARWFEKQTFHRGPDLQNPGQMREYNPDQVKLIQKQYPDFPSVQQSRKVVKRAFLGKEVLGKVDQPLVPAGKFGWECVTGYRDKINAQFYGMVRAAKDPQRWTNKFFSQVMFLLNSQSKGGIAAERGAFEDDRQAEKSWANSDEITWMTKNALQGQNPKVIPKPAAQFPAGFFTLFQESKEEINKVTGLSREFIGTREVDQAGVLEAQRRQSSLNLLASLFNSLRRYRKRQGQTMLYLIQNHLSDGRLIRIVGEGKKQYVPLTRDSITSAEYDVIVDDAPTSPNEKERTWGILMQLLPMLKEMLTPDVALELMEYSPLPASLVEEMRKKREAAAQQPKPPSPEEQRMQFEQQRAQLHMAGTQMDLQAKQQSNQMDIQMKGIDLMVKNQQANSQMALDRQKLQNDMTRLAVQGEANRIAEIRANAKQTSAAGGN